MRLLTQILLAIGCAYAQAADTIVARYSSSYGEKEYQFVVTMKHISSSPAWSRVEHETPPLAAQKAVSVARAQLRRLLKNSNKWRPIRITLEEVGEGKWLYLIEFQAPLPANGLDGRLSTMKLVVLMNGVAVEPAIVPKSD